MAETSLKRLRDDESSSSVEEEEMKRHKSSSSSSTVVASSSSYNQILSLLEEDEEEPNQDLSSLMTSLQNELSSSSEPRSEPTPEANSESEPNTNLTTIDSSTSSFEDDEDKERVIRHLLEASDDELGIPNTVVDDDGINGIGGSLEFSVCDGLWEFEDEAANYYTLLQSELFM